MQAILFFFTLRTMFYLPLSLFNFISLLNFFLFPPQCFHSLLRNFYYFRSSIFLFPSSTSTSSFILYIFRSTNTSTSYRPHIDPTSTPHRPYIDPTSTPHRPYIDPSSTPHRPHNQRSFNTAS